MQQDVVAIIILELTSATVPNLAVTVNCHGDEDNSLGVATNAAAFLVFISWTANRETSWAHLLVNVPTLCILPKHASKLVVHVLNSPSLFQSDRA